MKLLEQSILMIVKLILKTQMTWRVFIKTFRKTIQIKKRKILIALDDMIADLLSNRKLDPIRTELFIRDRKLNISLAFIMQSYFAVPKNIRQNSTHYVKIPYKGELQRIICNNSSDIDFKDGMNL